MIEMTVNRLRPLLPRNRIWIVTSAEQARAMARRMPSFPKSNFIVEPVGRDSAGAVMLGCATIAQKDPHAVMALLPSDHLIRNAKAYLRVLRDCFDLAGREKVLVTIGIQPREASSAYGYIERGDQRSEVRGERSEQKKPKTKIFLVRRFLEKPGLKTARRLVKSKRFYWNAGMFVWSASAILDAFRKHSPIHAGGWNELQKNPRRYLRSGFRQLPKISVDYAIMEKARNIQVAEGIFDWDDVGSWSSLPSRLSRDSKGNCVYGNALLLDSKNSLVLGGKKMIATLGVRDLVIVQTDDATLVCHRNSAQRVKELVQRLPKDLR